MSTIASSQDVVARITDRLAASVGAHRYNMWFDRSARLDYDDRRRHLAVTVPNRFVADWIGQNFERELRDAARSELGDPVTLDVSVDDAPFRAAPSVPHRQSLPQPAKPPTQAASNRLRHELGDFIVGPSNELAYGAAVDMAGSNASGTTTLFIHGGCGLGKTHLLQGVCRAMLKSHPASRVRYTTAERFTNEFLASMRAGNVGEFRTRIRRLDLLAVDDVHFLAGKQATQQEFLHSFDTIDLSGSRVAMASDSHPKLIDKLSKALISRCLRGMVAQVTQPNTATRIKIVRALAQRRGLGLLDSVIEALAGRCDGSVREIEGTLTKLHALMQLASERRGGDGNPDAAGHMLLNRLFEAERRDPPKKAISFETICNHVAEYLRISPSQVMGRSRNRHVVQARSLVVYLTRRITTMSYPEIAAAMNRSNHSTVITAAHRIKKRLEQGEPAHLVSHLDPMSLDELVDCLHQRILGSP